MGNTVANVVVKVGANVDGMVSGLNNAEKHLHSAASTFTKVGKKLTLGVTAPIVGMGTTAVYSAIKFDKAMFGVNSVLKLNATEFAKYKQEVLDFSTTTSQSSVEVAHALRLISAHSYNASDSMKILRVSVDAAGNMMSDTETTTRALVGALQAYGAPASEVRHYADLMETAVNKSGMSFDMLSHNIGMATGVAANAGVSFESLLASLMSLRKQGYDVSEGIVYTRAMLVSLLKPSADLQDVYKKWGYETGQAALKSLGLTGVLMRLQEETHGDASAMVKLFHNTRALQAVMALSRNGAAEFTESLYELAGASAGVGEHERMRAIRHQSVAYQMAKMKSELEVFTIEMGTLLLPTLTKVVHSLTKLFTALNHLSPGTKKVIGAFILFAAAIGPVLMTIGAIANGLSALGAVVGLISPAIGALGAIIGGIGAPILIVVAAAVLLYEAWKHNWLGIRDITHQVVTWLKVHVGGFVESVINFFKRLYHQLVGGSIIPDMFAAMKRLFTGFFTWAIGRVTGFVANVLHHFAHLAKEGISKISNLVTQGKSKLASFATQGASKARTLATGVLQQLSHLAKSGLAHTKNFVNGAIADYKRFKDNGDSTFKALAKTGLLKLTELRDSGLSILGGFAEEAYSRGASLASRFGAGIRAKLHEALDAARNLVSQIRALLPHSDAETGPLSDLTASGRALPHTIASGIREGEPRLIWQAHATMGKLAAVVEHYKHGVSIPAGESFASRMGIPAGEPFVTGNMGMPGGEFGAYRKTPGVSDTTLAWMFPGGGVDTMPPAPGSVSVPRGEMMRPIPGQGTTNVTINVHNPAPEPAGQSITDQLRNLSYLGVLQPIGATSCQ